MRFEMVMEELAGSAMTIEIVPMSLDHLESFRRALDIVARERKYLGKLQAPPIEKMQAFVTGNMDIGAPQFLALDGDNVVGWCDLTPMVGEARAHRGGIGMGILPEERGRGLGRRLLVATLEAAAPLGLTRVELDVYDDNQIGRAHV